MLIGSSALQQTLVSVLVFCSVSVNGMASWFAKDYCLTPLEAGEVIMGDFAIVSEERRVVLSRASPSSGLIDTYEPGETLFAYIDDDKGQFVFDLGGGASFLEGGGCEGKRLADRNGAKVKMPLNGEVTLKAGWSTGHMQVKISPTITLRPSREVVIPTMTINGKLRGGAEVAAPVVAKKNAHTDESANDSSIFPEKVQIWVGLLSIFLFGGFILACSYCLHGAKGLTKAAKSV